MARPATFAATMNDPRYDQLASLLTRFSIQLKKGEKVLIDAFDIPDTMTIATVRAARRAASSSMDWSLAAFTARTVPRPPGGSKPPHL